MKITFDYMQEKGIKEKNTEFATKGVSKTNSDQRMDAGKKTAALGVLFGRGIDEQAYGKAGKTNTDIKNEMSLLSGEDYKNYMVVMSSCMSGEDFSALIEDGVKPGKIEAKDMVTIMDHIKAVMAQSGVVISGFNGSGDISMDKLEALAGDRAYAQSVKKAFEENRIPFTEENAKKAVKQTNLALEIQELTDSMKQYLLENGCDFSIHDIYKASFSAEKKNSSQIIPTGGSGNYFADNMDGYFGKTPEETDYQALGDQIDKVIKAAGLTVNEETRAEAAWILEKGIFLTEDNLTNLHEMNQMKFPMNRDEILSHVAQTIREGKKPEETNLLRDGIYRQAEAILETVGQITETAVESVISQGETLNIRNLDRAQREIELSLNKQMHASDENFIHAQRTLEEVRLRMTISANIMLLKSNYSIDTTELSQLVEELKYVEEEQGKTYGLTLLESDKNALFKETMNKTAAIRQMPAAILPGLMEKTADFTLNQVYERGKVSESIYRRAGESYEALMTRPRADLGDRIRDAFSNIDDILSDMKMELSEDNRRAVRILAYNQMDITNENLVRVRDADITLNRLLEKMTPSATLQMIREDVNPLEESVWELIDYFDGQEGDLTQQTETFSKFLYKMEKDNQISPKERDSYMGIYRLIRQIEKGDGKAIGAIVATGQQLSFANLLSAVRTNQKKGIDVVIDDEYGLLSGINSKGVRISDQINHYYEMKASDLLTHLDPQLMSRNQVTMDTTWEELIETSEKGGQNRLEMAYREEQLNHFRNLAENQADTPVIEYLLSSGQAVTWDNLEGAAGLLKRRGEVFRQIQNMLPFPVEKEVFKNVTEHFTDASDAQNAYENMKNVLSEGLEEFMLSGKMGYLDVRALSSISKQLSLAGNMAKEENYEIPVVIDGQLTSVNVHFRSNPARIKGKGGNVAIQVSLFAGEKIFADFQLQGEKISGYVGCNDKLLLEKIQKKRDDFTQNILLETGKTADINFVYSEELKVYSSGNVNQAGKPAHGRTEPEKDKSEKIQKNQTEGVQGSHTSARELYLAAKTFIGLLGELS